METLCRSVRDPSEVEAGKPMFAGRLLPCTTHGRFRVQRGKSPNRDEQAGKGRPHPVHQKQYFHKHSLHVICWDMLSQRFTPKKKNAGGVTNQTSR